MRSFSTHGRVRPEEHYVVPRTVEVADFIRRVKMGKYIVLFAPRQTGKTTFFRLALSALTAEEPSYFPIQLDFQSMRNFSPETFYERLTDKIRRQIAGVFQKHGGMPSEALAQFLEDTPLTDGLSMVNFFEDLTGFLDSDAHMAVPAFNRVVLLIDEFDGIPSTVVSDFLYALREVYLSGDMHCPHSVGIVGVKNIAQLDYDQSVSPFNIQDEFKLPNFTVKQVDALFSQYTDEVGQALDPEVIHNLHKQTAGQPFLVNRFAQILTEELDIPKTATITLSHFEKAHALLIEEDNTNFTHLITNIRRDRRFESFLMRVASYDKGIRFAQHNEVISELAMYGIIGRGADGMCEIINPIYQQYIMQAFQPLFNGLEDEYFGKNSDTDFIDYLTPSGTLDMRPLLDNFRDFIARAGFRILQVPDTPQEFVGQYLLSAYLDQFVRSVGAVMFLEVQTGRGRMDLLLLHNGRKYIVETKIWEGFRRYQAGKKQLAAYLQLESTTEGYYIVFDHRETPEPRVETETIDGVSIRSYVIPVIQQRPSNGHLQTELVIG